MRKLGLVIAGICLLGVPYVANADLDCKNAAIAQKKVCKAECIDEFHTAKFVCRGINPVCGNPCLAGKISCVQNVRASLESCVDGCQADLAANKLTCVPPPPCNGDPACDACVDAFQVQAFICRDNCREAFNLDPAKQAALALCRSTFKACIQACN